MNLYLISQESNLGLVVYTSAVVAASSKKEARDVHPSGDQDNWSAPGLWVARELVDVKLLGRATSRTRTGVVLARYI